MFWTSIKIFSGAASNEGELKKVPTLNCLYSFFCLLLSKDSVLAGMVLVFLLINNSIIRYNNIIITRFIDFHQDSSAQDRWIRAYHRDKARVQMPAKMFPRLKLLCWLFMGPTLGFDTKQ
jgi:hypothetical protein